MPTSEYPYRLQQHGEEGYQKPRHSHRNSNSNSYSPTKNNRVSNGSRSNTPGYNYYSSDRKSPQADSEKRTAGDVSNDVTMTYEEDTPPEPEYKRYLRQFFNKEPCEYSHRVFQHASTVIQALRHEPRDEKKERTLGVVAGTGGAPGENKPKPIEIPNINFENENEKRLTFTLVFSSLKYQRFLEDMFEDCSFFSTYPEFKEDISLLMVMLCDFKQRKFQRREPLPEETLVPYCTLIEEALWKCRTKLNAALARSRIKARVLSIDHLLPDSVRQNDKIGSNMHIYCWVNLMKTTVRQIQADLKTEGFSMVQEEAKLVGKTYILDHQCTDMIAFSYDQRDFLEQHALVTDQLIAIQDKSSCVGAHSIRALINEGDDILQLNVGSGMTTVHLASLTHGSDTIIHAFGIRGDKQYKQVLGNLEQYGVKSRVKLFTDDFMEAVYTDERLKHIKVVLVTAECSRSGVANPVNFIVSEGEEDLQANMSILKDLSLGYTDELKLGELVIRHNSLLKHALRFPRVQAVVYCTRSLLEAENEGVVTRAIEYVNMIQNKKTPFRIAPPVLPLSDRDIELENPLNGKYLRYPPSSLMSGCFIATVTREADDPKEAAKDILARAAARGIITGVVQSKDDKPKAKKKDKKKEKTDKTKRKRSPVQQSTSTDIPAAGTGGDAKPVRRKTANHKKAAASIPAHRPLPKQPSPTPLPPPKHAAASPTKHDRRARTTPAAPPATVPEAPQHKSMSQVPIAAPPSTAQTTPPRHLSQVTIGALPSTPTSSLKHEHISRPTPPSKGTEAPRQDHMSQVTIGAPPSTPTASYPRHGRISLTSKVASLPKVAEAPELDRTPKITLSAPTSTSAAPRDGSKSPAATIPPSTALPHTVDTQNGGHTSHSTPTVLAPTATEAQSHGPKSRATRPTPPPTAAEVLKHDRRMARAAPSAPPPTPAPPASSPLHFLDDSIEEENQDDNNNSNNNNNAQADLAPPIINAWVDLEPEIMPSLSYSTSYTNHAISAQNMHPLAPYRPQYNNAPAGPVSLAPPIGHPLPSGPVHSKYASSTQSLDRLLPYRHQHNSTLAAAADLAPYVPSHDPAHGPSHTKHAPSTQIIHHPALGRPQHNIAPALRSGPSHSKSSTIKFTVVNMDLRTHTVVRR